MLGAFVSPVVLNPAMPLAITVSAFLPTSAFPFLDDGHCSACFPSASPNLQKRSQFCRTCRCYHPHRGSTATPWWPSINNRCSARPLQTLRQVIFRRLIPQPSCLAHAFEFPTVLLQIVPGCVWTEGVTRAAHRRGTSQGAPVRMHPLCEDVRQIGQPSYPHRHRAPESPPVPVRPVPKALRRSSSTAHPHANRASEAASAGLRVVLPEVRTTEQPECAYSSRAQARPAEGRAKVICSDGERRSARSSVIARWVQSVDCIASS